MLKETNTSDLEFQHVFALIVGKSGKGKTFAIGSLPEKETIILSAESGLLTLSDKSYDVWIIESVEDLVEAYQRLINGTKYKYIAIDSLTEISDICFAKLKPQFNKSQKFGLYEEFTDRMIDIIKKFRDLNSYNTFITSLIKETSEGNYILSVAQKSLGERIPSLFDFTFMVEVFEKDGKKERALVSDNSVLDFLKSRSNKIDDYERVDLTAICNKVLNQESK